MRAELSELSFESSVLLHSPQAGRAAKCLLASWSNLVNAKLLRDLLGLGAFASLCRRTPPSLHCERRAAKLRDLAFLGLKRQRITASPCQADSYSDPVVFACVLQVGCAPHLEAVRSQRESDLVSNSGSLSLCCVCVWVCVCWSLSPWSLGNERSCQREREREPPPARASAHSACKHTLLYGTGGRT